MILAAALMFRPRRRGAGAGARGAGGDDPQAAARRRSRTVRKSRSRSASRIIRARSRSCSASPTRTTPALAVVARLRAAYPGQHIDVVIDATRGRLQSQGRQSHQHERAHRARHRRPRRQRHPRAEGLSVAPRRRARTLRRRGDLSLLRHLDRQLVVAAGAVDHRQPFPAGRRGRHAPQARAAVPRIDHRAAAASR